MASVLLFGLYSAFALLRHRRMETAGYDLGIFDQAVRSYAGFHAPLVQLKGPDFNLLGDHFHPVLVALVPLYRIEGDARTLLIAQAALFAASAVPIGRLAVRRLGTAAGTGVTVAYGLSWGLQGAVAFDFHEVAFAVPVLAFALVRLVEERWESAALWSLPLLLVKEDMGLVVAAVGAYLAWRGRVRLGLLLSAAGLTAMALVIGLVIPHFSPSGEYRYWNQLNSGGERSTGAVLLGFPASLAEHPQKLTLLFCLAVVTAFVAFRSPLLVIAAPMVAYRILSTQPLQWSTGVVHYNAVLMPIAFAAFLQAQPLLKGSRLRAVRGYARAAPLLVVLIAALMLPSFAFWRLTHAGIYTTPARVHAAKRLMSRIPSGTRVAASNYLAPQLTGRCEVTLFADALHRPADWVIVDTATLGGVPAPRAVQEARLGSLPAEGYRLVAQESGVMLFAAR